MKNRLDLQYYPIPEGFEVKKATVGKGKKPTQEIVTTSYAFASEKQRQIRAAHVQEGSSLQVLYFVIFPHLNFDLPFFGADLFGNAAGWPFKCSAYAASVWRRR